MADIRSFFPKKGSTTSTAAARGSGRGQTKRKAVAVIISDDEDDDFKPAGPTTKSVAAKAASKVKRSRPRIQYDSDSDDNAQPIHDHTSSSTVTTITTTTVTKSTIKKSTTRTSSTKTTQGRKEVSSAAAFFGSAPVKRSSTPVHNGTERKTRKTSRSSSPSVVPESPTDITTSHELEPHDDDAFVKTLEQLDTNTTNTSSGSTMVPPAKKLKQLVDTAAPSRVNQVKKETSSPPRKATAVQSTPPKQLKPLSPPPVQQSSAPSHTPPPPQRKSSHTPPQQRKSSSHTPPPSRRSSSSSHTPPVHSPAPSETTQQQQPTPPVILAQRSSNYRAYLNRGGPRAPGSKEIPVGAENCLEGLTFVFTGVLESMERDDAADLVKRYGGRVTGNISKKTSYVVMGEGAGESKMNKAKQLGTKPISEDELLELIRTRPPKTLTTPTRTSSKQTKRRISSSSSEQAPSSVQYSPRACAVSPSLVTKMPHPPTTPTSQSSNSQASVAPSTPGVAMDTGPSCLMWVDKYRPKTTKQIIGQQGDKSCVNKLKRWLRDWHTNRDKNGSGAARKSGFNDDGTLLKAALLSGPPGVGKTTSATLVCQELGYSFTELNASATRSKKSLQEHVSTQLSNLAMDSFITGGSGAASGKRHALVMDEVDGMAGNEDRGGVQELIQLIKTTRIPIICICNDRQHPKIRSLSNYCLDLRFNKPRLEQIKGPMMSISFKEGVKIAPQALNEVITASGNDIRQVLHNLSVWTAASRSLSYDDAKSSAQNARKEMKQSPFEVIRSVFMPMDAGREMSFSDKSDLFFKDYSMGPLFVQENYPTVKLAGKCDIHQALHRLSCTADAIACGDIVSTVIRTSSSYGLLPVQAVFSSVVPGEFMRGYLGKPEFPSWLGNNSKRNRSDRLLQELRQHTRLSSSSDKLDFGMHYLPYLQQRLTRPLIKQEGEGVAEVVSVMQAYNLVRDDWDTVNELAHYSTSPDPTNQIASKVKAAFTRTLNKECHALPYSMQSSIRKRSRQSLTDDTEDPDYSDEEDDDEDISKSAMVKVKRVQSSDARGSAVMSKGRGKGPAKGGAKLKTGKTKK